MHAVHAMKVELLVSEWCATCPAAEKVWRDVATERDFELSVLDAAQPEGRELVARLRLRSVPSTVIDGVLQAVGVPTPDDARTLVAAAPVRARAPVAQHAGMTLSRDNRVWIATSMGYLLASGLIMLTHGSLLADGAGRAASVHVFGAGFALCLIYALGAHMLPRFTGNPIAMAPWTWLQLACTHSGLPMLVAGLWMRSGTLAAAGGSLLWLSLAIFAARVVPVLFPREGALRGAEHAAEPS
jgi:Thioredoxin domain